MPALGGQPVLLGPQRETRALYRRYETLAVEQADVTFVGRLARYQYLNVDQVTAQALQTFKRIAASAGAVGAEPDLTV